MRQNDLARRRNQFQFFVSFFVPARCVARAAVCPIDAEMPQSHLEDARAVASMNYASACLQLLNGFCRNRRVVQEHTLERSPRPGGIALLDPRLITGIPS